MVRLILTILILLSPIAHAGKYGPNEGGGARSVMTMSQRLGMLRRLFRPERHVWEQPPFRLPSASLDRRRTRLSESRPSKLSKQEIMTIMSTRIRCWTEYLRRLRTKRLLIQIVPLQLR